MEYVEPEDKPDETCFQTKAIKQSQEPVDTPDNKYFTIEDIRNAAEIMGNEKAPGEDGIPGKIYKRTFETFRSYITALYNGCLSRGVFRNCCKRAKLIPNTKSGKKISEDVSTFRPINLLNIEGKVLEKVLINGINHHVFSRVLVNNNQYGFTPQRSTFVGDS
jgi:hypothetical protein